MISKKTFVKAMKEITKHDDFEAAINKELRDYNDDSSIMSNGLEGVLMYVIQEQFNDLDDDWLGYLCYERNYLRDYELGDIQFADGSSPELNNWEDVYDFLVRCMNEKKTRKE